MSDHTPILVGIAHVEQREQDPALAAEPLALMLQASERAAADAGIALNQASSIRVVRGMWPYSNPAAVLAEQIGRPDAETVITQFGGNFVQSCVNQTALDIQAGLHDLVLITGAECGQTQARAARKGQEPAWQAAPGTPDKVIGADKEMRHAVEQTVRIGRPIQVYPLFESAIRHHAGRSIEAHQTHISELWSRFAAVAAHNPNAWIQEAKSAEEIRTPSEINRPVSSVYPKFMNSNNNVDQGAALIMCSVAKAEALGIPQSQWIYPWAGTDGSDHNYVSNRDRLFESPAIRLAGQRCLELAGLNATELDRVDVYSCFPSAVQVAAQELGLDIEAPLTVTGGLTWAGGPLNKYVMHSIVRMAELLRLAPDEKGLITANGGYLTKHAFGVYSATAPTTPFRHADLQAEIDALTFRDVLPKHNGTETVESYSVMYGPEGLLKAFVTVVTAEGQRAWGVTQDPDVLEDMTRHEYCGRAVNLADQAANF